MGLTSSIGGVVNSLLAKGPVSAPDLSALFKTIDDAGAKQKDWINALPNDLQKQYAAYKSANAGTADTLKSTIAGNDAKLMADTKANYDPNGPAVKAALDAAKTSIYADVPGQQDAIREALASTGGFGRGTAAKQLAAPVIAAGEKLGQATLDITANQLQKQQTAVQSAVNTINTIDDQTAKDLFGMSREEALQILNGNRDDLKDQLTNLINQSNNQTNQKLGVQGMDIQNKYNQAVAERAASNAKTAAWVNLGTDVATAMPGFMSGMGGAPSFNPSAPQFENMLPGA